MAGAFVFGSISPMTARISPDGQRSQVSARLRAFSRRRFRRCFGPRCGCARPGAPTPACMPSARSPMSTFRSMRCPMPILVRPDQLNRNSCRWSGVWAGCCPPTFGSAGSSARLRVSTHDSRRCAATTSTGSRPLLRGGAASGPLYHRLAAPAGRGRDDGGVAKPVGTARLRRVLPSPRGRYHDSRPAAAGLVPRGRSDHRTRQRRRVLLVDGAVAGRRAAGRRRTPAHRDVVPASCSPQRGGPATSPPHRRGG